MGDVARLLAEADGLAATGRHHEALACLMRVVAAPDTPPELSSSTRVRATVAAIRMYDLRTARDLIDSAGQGALTAGDTERLRLLDLVVNGLIGDTSATDHFVTDVAHLLDGPLPPEDLKFVVEGVTLAIARAGRRDDLLDVVLRAAGMAREIGRNELVSILLIAEAAYRSRADLAGAVHAARKAVELSRANEDWANLPFALAQVANAEAGLGDDDALVAATQLESFGAPAALLVAAHARAYLAYTLGDFEAAFGQLRMLDKTFGYMETPPISWHADLIELALIHGDHPTARSVFIHLQAIADLSDMPWTLAAVDRCAGLLSAGEVGEQLTQQAIERFNAGGYTISAARTELGWARRQRLTGDERWRDHAASAEAAFNRAGMAHWAVRCGMP